jgi:TonB family protein
VIAELGTSDGIGPLVNSRNRRLGSIFVSYRRTDSQGEAGRLFDDLVNHFGEQMVFMDVAGIEAGRDFRKAIEDGVAKCGVILVVIGPQWLDAKDESGAGRLDDPADFVRIETASALRRDIPVIPVLVRGAEMPRAEELPEDLKDLAYRNCIELTHARWRSDIQLLTEALRRLVGDASHAEKEGGPNQATTSARPGPGDQQVTSSPKVEDRRSARIDPVVLQRVGHELALHIGQIADIVVRRAAPHCTSIEDLYLKVAEEIDSPDERQDFLLNRVPIPSPSLPDVAGPATQASRPSGISGPPPPSEGDELIKPSLPPIRIPPSGRTKYWLLAGGSGILLALILVLVTRFASSRAGSSQTAQTAPQETHIAESAPVETGAPSPPAEASAKNSEAAQSPASPGTDETKPGPAERIRVKPEVSQGLLVSTVLPVYPLLARQARVRGVVVLEADISKDGTVESLRLISGHPMLAPAAIEAVKQWRYKPYVLNGEPLAVSTQVIVNFTLSGE